MRRLIVLLLVLLVIATACSGSDEPDAFVEIITPQHASEVWEDGGDDLVVLDIRTAEEFDQARIAGAVNIDYYGADFRRRLGELDPEARYLVYCRTGNRSEAAVPIMEGLGFTRIYQINGGIAAWYEAGFPIE